MDDQQKQIAEDKQPRSMSVLDLSTLINDYIRTIDDLKSQLRTHRQMVKDALMNDKNYYDLTEKAKALGKEKNARKQVIMKEPAVEAAVAKVQEATEELKDFEDKLSGYLQEYQRVAGTTMFEGSDGDIRQIVPVYKLVKKSKFSP
ncbi:MAG: hypothetical protein US11_C0001G0131 [Candidatus Roizmanbacteria bacterium GW2011_GWA2_36_23]|uniref:Uncharacterized protein n=1 Tax=Candidatus Roizmanbacteria bacterium GW2011_GWA2_36_23 TaxID=1618480 RepID=A0A0G0E9K0_9BACT|nr:MAG: hypothetical protein US11_C0001G0131 [Candidatus Roizmanbacteria bacterium GW2011_GWA2_36_23]